LVTDYMQSMAPEFKLAEMTGHWNIGTVCTCHFVSSSGLFGTKADIKWWLILRGY
jgi:hypothetical protein